MVETNDAGRVQFKLYAHNFGITYGNSPEDCIKQLRNTIDGVKTDFAIAQPNPEPEQPELEFPDAPDESQETAEQPDSTKEKEPYDNSDKLPF